MANIEITPKRRARSAKALLSSKGVTFAANRR